MPSPSAIHRHTDSRACGAGTVVSGQNTVYANNLLVSVDGDPNDHGAGNLNAACCEVYVNGILVVNIGDSAAPDSFCIPVGGAHCAPSATGGSPNVFVGDVCAELPLHQYGTPLFTDTPVSYPVNIQPAINDPVPEIAKAEQVDTADETIKDAICGEVPFANPYDTALDSGPGFGWNEIAGSGANPRITSIWTEIGYQSSYADHTAWCAVYVGAMLKRSGCTYKKTASSRAYASYGKEVLSISDIENNWNSVRGQIKKGDILVFYRKGKTSAYGHVGFSNGTTTSTRVECLGGNQSDSLNIKSFPKFQNRRSGPFGLIAVRRAVKCDGSGEVVPDAGSPAESASGSGGSVT